MSARKKYIRILVESAILVAMSTVLSLIKIWPMPLGGAVTLLSMLPVCVISIRHGIKWGFGAAFVYSVIQLVLGITMDGVLGWGLTPAMLIGCIMFDYIIAFTVLGLAGAFRVYGEVGIYAGISLAMLARFISHFLSGYIIFKNLEQWQLFGKLFENKPFLYSFTYNGCYMFPELAFTLTAVVILMRIRFMRKNVFLLEKR